MAALTARGRGLDCLQPQPRQPVLRRNKLRIFRFHASAKAQPLRLFLLSPQSGHFVGAPIMARRCVSKQIGLPAVRFSLAGSSLPGRRARRARFPPCGVIRVAGYSVVWDCDPTSIFSSKSTKRSAAAILGRSAPSFLFHGALRNILLSAGFPVTIHMIALEQTFVNNSLQKFFLLLLPFQIESILSVIYISLLNISLFYCVGFFNVG